MFTLKTYKRTKIIKLTALLLLAAVLTAGLSACSRQAREYSSFAMGSMVTAALYADEATADGAWDEVSGAISELDSLISATDENSDISRLSALGKVNADPKTIKIVSDALGICRLCSGRIDITLGELTQLWGFTDDEPSLPDAQAIAEALKTKDLNGLLVDAANNVITATKGQKLDLGAFGKGAACDAAYSALTCTPVSSAVITAGGSVLLYGDAPGKDAWTVGIRDPFGTANDYFAVLSVSRFNDSPCAFISTSGSYEKAFEENGKTYHHLLNPETGYPAENGLVSVTVVTTSGMTSDALSTACFVNGLNDETLGWLDSFRAQAVFVFEDGGVYATVGLADALTIDSDAFRLIDYDAK